MYGYIKIIKDLIMLILYALVIFRIIKDYLSGALAPHARLILGNFVLMACMNTYYLIFVNIMLI